MSFKKHIAYLTVIALIMLGSFINALRVSSIFVQPIKDDYPLTDVEVVINENPNGNRGVFYRFFYNRPGSFDENFSIYVSAFSFKLNTNPSDLVQRIEQYKRSISNQTIKADEMTAGGSR